MFPCGVYLNKTLPNFNLHKNPLRMRYSNIIRMVGFGQRAKSCGPHRGQKLRSYKGNVG